METQSPVITIDHNIIREWAINHNGSPAVFPHQNALQKNLAIGFADDLSKDMQAVSWDEWFRIFEDRKLAFIYKKRSGRTEMHPFYELVSRQEQTDRHLQSPGEANLDKHINFPELEE